MSFLELNGWTVPVARGGSRTPIIIGDQGRSFNGDLLNDRRIIKQNFQYETSRINQLDANALVGTLLGRGHNFPFDADLYSGKGLSPGSSVAAIRPGIAASGEDIVDIVTGIRESKYGAGSAAFEPAGFNLIPADSRDAENAPTGYSIVGSATLAAGTTYYAQGTKSLKITTTGSGDGADTGNGTASPSTIHAGSVYIFATSAITLNVSLRDDSGQIGINAVTTVANKWTRASVSGTTGGGATIVYLRITQTGAGANTIYCDAFQVEVGSSTPTSWADPTRAATDLEYSPSFLTVGLGLTFAAWVRGPTAAPSSDEYLFQVQQLSTRNSITVIRTTGGDIEFTVTGDTGGSSVVDIVPGFDNDWHHLAVVVTGRELDGSSKAYGYVDGVFEDSQSLSDKIDFSLLTDMYIGNANGGSSLFSGLIDEVMILPFAATASQIAAWDAETKQMPNLPKLRAKGDSIESTFGLEVEGRVNSRDYSGVSIGGTWNNTAQKVRFQLET